MTEFKPFPKIPRYSRGIIISEKIDGTNAIIHIEDDGATMLVGSRTKWITPQSDNYGFARWCEENKSELLKLGPGTHYGEWYGAGIQRTYGLKEKRFALFNSSRWAAVDARPSCCGVVPILYQGIMNEDAIESTLQNLKEFGSKAVPGFMNPEGIVIFHTASSTMFKKTIKDDESPKSL